MHQQRFSDDAESVDKVEDIELRRNLHASSVGIETRYLDALEGLFGLPRNQIAQWPGIFGYCKFLESCFDSVLQEEYESLWKALDCSPPHSSTEVWVWFSTTCHTLRRLHQDDHSIEDVWNDVQASLGISRHRRSDDMDDSPCKIAVFANLCWATMTLQPTLLLKELKGQPSLAVKYQGRNCSGLKMSFAERPIPAAFREFQHTLPGGRWHQPIGGGSNIDGKSVALYVSTLNYATLKSISKIQLEWVNDLSSHLEFDPVTRVLSIFRFPSFCAMSTLGTNGSPILEGYVDRHCLLI